MRHTLEYKWTISRAQDTYGYNICTLRVDGVKRAACNGGGYDMMGTCLGEYIAKAFPEKLLKLTKEFYGLTFHDPNYDPGKAIVEGETVEQREKEGKTVGLDRYVAHYSASTKLPDATHTIPEIDGAAGMSSVEQIIHAIGFQLTRIKGGDNAIYLLEEVKV